MNWTRVKTILIVFLAVLNICLGVIYFSRYVSAASAESSAEDDLRAVLSQYEIALVDRAVTPLAQKAQVLEIGRDLALEQAAAQAVLGDCSVMEQGGGIYEYRSEKGWARFRGGGLFEITLETPLALGGRQNPESFMRALLRSMGYDQSVGEYIYTPSAYAASAETVAVTQELLDLPLWNGRIEASFTQDGLLSLGGCWLTGTLYLAEEEQTATSAATAVLALVSRLKETNVPCSEVTSVRPGYLARTLAPGMSRLIPVWLIETDKGGYYVDTIFDLIESS